MIFCVLVSCDKQKQVYIDTDNSVDTNTESIDDVSLDYNTITVPYREENGVKILNVRVDGVGFDMIFDTGCSETLISSAEAFYLLQKGLLTEDDIIGYTKSMIADGSIVENTVVNLKIVSIEGKINCYNVKAVVSNNISAPLLLGNEVLDRVASYTIDNENNNILFKLKNNNE
jgi:predicted aspartyl protease